MVLLVLAHCIRFVFQSLIDIYVYYVLIIVPNLIIQTINDGNGAKVEWISESKQTSSTTKQVDVEFSIDFSLKEIDTGSSYRKC